jgi:GNAT superfamily N-acetyltransferase
MRIRRAEARDRDTVAALLTRFHSLEEVPREWFNRPDRGPGWNAAAAAFELLLARPEYGFVLLAEDDDGTPAGVLTLLLKVSTGAGSIVPVVDDIYVEPEYRRRGVARAMVQWVAGFAREQGYPRIDTQVEQYSPTSGPFWHGIGFRSIGEYRVSLPLTAEAQASPADEPG